MLKIFIKKKDVPLSQKNAQVILKIAICTIVGVLAIKAKATILVPMSVYLISKNLNFTKTTPAKKVHVDESPISVLHTPSPPPAQNSDSEESEKKNMPSWSLFSGQELRNDASQESDGQFADNSSEGLQLFFGEDLISKYPPHLNSQELRGNADCSSEQKGFPSEADPLIVQPQSESNPRTPQPRYRKHASGKMATLNLPDVQEGGAAAGAQPGKRNRHRNQKKQ